MVKCWVLFGILVSFSFTEAVEDSSFSSQGIAYDFHWPSMEEIPSLSKIFAYRVASYLTDPLCKAREYTVRSQILEDLPPSPYMRDSAAMICSYVRGLQLVDDAWFDPDRVAVLAEKSFLLGGAAIFAALTPVTTLSGMALRFAASNLETEPFVHYMGTFRKKRLESGSFTHMLWNVCGVKAGYDMEEGGQMPIRDDLIPFEESRLAKVAKKIREENPDVLCLNEVFDINDAIYLVGALQDSYAHFVIQCGSRTEGLNSGLFFATKFGVKDISFTPFPKDLLVGDTKHAEKGFLTVRMHDIEGQVGVMMLTHLQQSDEPGYPTFEERMARAGQLEMMRRRVDSYPEGAVILAGDLNLDDEEFERFSSECYSRFIKTKEYDAYLNEESKTWLGDKWYVEYGNRENTFSLIPAGNRKVKRRVSGGINLDHVLVKIRSEGITPGIQTVLHSTGYDPKKISRESLSDHMILLSTITQVR